MASEDEDYIVRLASGDVRAMTLTQLDAAFHDGRVGAGTPIVAPGGCGWSTLGELASLELDEEPASLVPVVTAHVAVPDDAELERLVPRASRLVTIAIVAFVFAALGTVAVVTLRSRAGGASVANAAVRVEQAPRSVPLPPPPEPAVPTPVPERAASAAPPATASSAGTQEAKRTNATRIEDRKKKPRTRHK
jgi:hypothetical protein